MATSGQVTLITESVDYGGGRGAVTLTNVIGWSVGDDSKISFWSISSSDNSGGYWGLCYGSNPYYVRLVPQVSYNGGSTWANLDEKKHLVSFQCTNPSQPANYTNVVTMSLTLIGQLGSYTLTGDCQLRFLYYMDPTPAPSAANPRSFPNSSYSSVSQVPVYVDVSWTATVNYDANGGANAPAAQTITQSADTYDFTLSNDVPTRDHYRFEGWSTNQSASSADYQPGDTFTVNRNNPTITLYAVWKKFYHPGAVMNSNSQWLSHDRDAGTASVLSDLQNVWFDMRTIDAPTGLGDPPSIYHDSKYFNQQKFGKE